MNRRDFHTVMATVPFLGLPKASAKKREDIYTAYDFDVYHDFGEHNVKILESRIDSCKPFYYIEFPIETRIEIKTKQKLGIAKEVARKDLDGIITFVFNTFNFGSPYYDLKHGMRLATCRENLKRIKDIIDYNSRGFRLSIAQNMVNDAYNQLCNSMNDVPKMQVFGYKFLLNNIVFE